MRREIIIVPLTREDVARLVADYLDRGGIVTQVAFGVSGHCYGFRVSATTAGRIGWWKRYGLKGVPADAKREILRGHISLAAARVELVWDALAAGDHGLVFTEVMAATSLAQEPAENTLELLLRSGHARKVMNGRVRFEAVPPRPTWTQWLQAA